MQVVDSEGYLKVKLVGGPVGPFVPYTGATANVDLGEYEIKVGQVEFDQTPTGTAGVAVMRWNDQDGTVDVGLKGGNVTLQVGQEQVSRVVNKTGSNLLEANYQAVRVDGVQGNRLAINLAQANNNANSAETLGLVTETINDNQEGFITNSGIVRNINTTGTLQGETWVDGNILYLSGTIAGQVTNIKPAAPIHTIIMGYVIRAHATQGQIYVKVDNGYELDELHNVAITTPLNDQVLQYESATSLWKNKTISSGITIGTTAITSGTVGRVLFEGTGNVVQESANLFWDNTNGRLGIGTSSPQARYSQSQTQGILARYDVTNANADQNRGVWEFYTNTAVTPDFFGRFGFKFEGGINNTSRQFQLHVGDNTNPRFVVNGSGNVLINTTTDAGFRLDVNGTARVSGLLTLNNNIEFSSYNRTIANSSFPLSAISTNQVRSLNDFYDSGGTNGFTFYNNGGTIRGRIYATGNWFIGSSPTDAGFRLDVNGTARVRGASNVSTTTAFTIANSDSTNLLQVQDNGYIRIGSQATSAFRVYATDTSGDSEPSGLHLVLNSRVVSQSTAAGIGMVTINGIAGTATTGNQNVFLISKGFSPTSGTATYAATSIIPTINQTGGANGITRGLFIDPTITAAADFRAIETTAGNVIFNGGNVGIGTSSPSAFLDVKGNVIFGTGNAVTVGTDQVVAIRSSTPTSRFYLQNSGTGTSALSGASFDLANGVFEITNRQATGTIGFLTNSSERMRIFASGNIGINTTTDAGYRLDVNGTARATSFTATTNGGTFMVNTTNLLDFGDGVRVGYSAAVGKVTLFTNAGTPRLQVVYSGSILIGTTTEVNTSLLTLESTTRGFLPPRMTTTQKNAIASPAAGLQIFDTTLNRPCFYDGTTWITL